MQRQVGINTDKTMYTMFNQSETWQSKRQRTNKQTHNWLNMGHFVNSISVLIVDNGQFMTRLRSI